MVRADASVMCTEAYLCQTPRRHLRMTDLAKAPSDEDDPQRIWGARRLTPQPERGATSPPRSHRAGVVLIVDDSSDAR